MRSVAALSAALSLLALSSSLVADEIKPAPSIDNYKLGPLSQENPAVPKGKVTQMPPWATSKVFPDTERDWWVYVPAQYDGSKPAALMVFQDGHDYVNPKSNWRVPIVFDNLIASGDMPVTIAVFINPGNKGPKPQSAWRNSNRSLEYDTVSGAYSKLLLDEILPEVQKQYKITENPEGWAIGGASSGGICSFTVGWDHPEKFHKVFSTIGSFTNIRGGNIYPYLIRITEHKPLRIFLQDGKNDVDNQFGSWPRANEMMAASLKYMNYDYQFIQGDGQHNSKHGGSIFPDAMKWLWRGWKEAGL